MATRFYISTAAAPVSPIAPGAEWEHVSSNADVALLVVADSSTLTTTAFTPDSADDLTNKDSMHRQCVSAPLAAQTISGNVTAQFQALEANAGNNLFLTMVFKVISNDGTIERATLLAITRAPGAEFTTSLRNTTFDSVALTNYTCIAGDRILIEVGQGGTCTAAGGTQGHNGSLRIGCSASSGDLLVNETEAGTTYRPWIEFANTLTFQDLNVTLAGVSASAATVSGNIVGTFALAGASVGQGTVSGNIVGTFVLGGASVAPATAAGALTVVGTVTLAGASAGIVTVSGLALLDAVLAGATVSLASVSGAIVVDRNIAATVVVTSITSGDLTVEEGVGGAYMISMLLRIVK